MTVGQQASADRFYCACGCFTLTVTAARRPRSAKGSSPRSHRLMIEQLSGGGWGPEIDGCSARAMPGEESHSGREWEWAKGLGGGLGVGLHGSAIFARAGAASIPLPALSVSQRQDLPRFSPWSRLLHLPGATLRRTIWASRIHGMVQRRRSCTPSATASARSGGSARARPRARVSPRALLGGLGLAVCTGAEGRTPAWLRAAACSEEASEARSGSAVHSAGGAGPLARLPFRPPHGQPTVKAIGPLSGSAQAGAGATAGTQEWLQPGGGEGPIWSPAGTFGCPARYTCTT